MTTHTSPIYTADSIIHRGQRRTAIVQHDGPGYRMLIKNRDYDTIALVRFDTLEAANQIARKSVKN